MLFVGITNVPRYDHPPARLLAKNAKFENCSTFLSFFSLSLSLSLSYFSFLFASSAKARGKILNVENLFLNVLFSWKRISLIGEINSTCSRVCPGKGFVGFLSFSVFSLPDRILKRCTRAYITRADSSDRFRCYNF